MKAMFYETTYANPRSFVVQDIEHLFVSAENILNTHFKLQFTQIQVKESEDEKLQFDL